MSFSTCHPSPGQRALSAAASVALCSGAVAMLASLSIAGGVERLTGERLVAFDMSGGVTGDVADDPASAQAAPPPVADPPPARRAAPPRPPRLPSAQSLPQASLPSPVAAPAAAVPSPPVPAIQPPQTPRPHQPQPRAAEQAAPAERGAEASAARTSQPPPGGGSSVYKALVWQHLQKFRRPNTVGPGAAAVRFAIDPRGNVTDLAVVTSSGSKRFDGEAMQMVRRAQPFPQPPTGQGAMFVFEIKGG